MSSCLFIYRGSYRRASRHSANRGVTLVEVLVAVLIVSFGLLSLLALQSNTLKYQRGSVQRAQVSALMADYIERVRTNLDQAPGVVAGSPYLLSDTWEAQAEIPEIDIDCLEAECNSAQLAAFDMAEWRQLVRDTLPQGAVFTQGTAARGITVTFMWADKEITGDGATLGAPAASAAASGAGETPMAQVSRCPEAAAAPDGVRCAVFVVMP